MLPARGAWIEIIAPVVRCFRVIGRSPHGERGLKYRGFGVSDVDRSRSPHGERGLKFAGLITYVLKTQSLPARGAWIEISFRPSCITSRYPSLPARGAWIEIEVYGYRWSAMTVAPRTGSVD